MKMNKIKKIISPLILLAFPLFASAQVMNDTRLSECLADGSCTVNHFIILLVIASEFIIKYSGVLALVAFVYGGKLFLTSAGNSEQVSKGKKIIIGSLIGLAIVFFSYTMISFIGKSLGISDFGISTGWF